MTEIQRLLTATIDDLNHREKRDNRPRFSISFIRKHPGLFVAMYAAWLATLIVMLKSETLVDSVWLLVVLFVVFNAFFFFDVNPATVTKISTSSISGSATTANGTTRVLCQMSLSTASCTLRLSKPCTKRSCRKWSQRKASSLFMMFLPFPALLLRN